MPYPYDKALYQKRHKVENLFAKLKDRRRIATLYDLCVHIFFQAYASPLPSSSGLDLTRPEPTGMSGICLRLPRMLTRMRMATPPSPLQGVAVNGI